MTVICETKGTVQVHPFSGKRGGGTTYHVSGGTTLILTNDMFTGLAAEV